MTDMKRTTVSLTDDIVEALERLKKQDEFKRCSYSELIRRLVIIGLANKEGK